MTYEITSARIFYFLIFNFPGATAESNAALESTLTFKEFEWDLEAAVVLGLWQGATDENELHARVGAH